MVVMMRERFPNNEDRRSFRIRRRLSRPSKQNLSFINEMSGSFPERVLKVKRVGEICLTQVEKGEVMRARQFSPTLGPMLFKDFASELLEAAPQSANQPKLFPVIGVDWIGMQQFETNVALMLGDPEGVLEDERNAYINRIQQLGRCSTRWKEQKPHLTLANLDILAGTRNILEWVEERAPSEVMLLPVDTDPRLNKLKD